MNISPTFSHVGITVPNLGDAVDWYREVLGYYLLAGPIAVHEDDSPLGVAATGIYGVGFTRFQFAHMASPDGAGFEVFQFDAPAYERPADAFEFWRSGVNHFAVTARDVAALAEQVVAAGGVQRSEVVAIDPDRGFEIVYCEDPWGNVFEACSHPYTYMWSG
ncbi:VOC family protein [Leucobacter luti]|uniref:Catechol 2,3-dioxygenase-like lactoylglutathione lyase family enzyme n=1 Tax=Leucobacter luti TaxID=340320 RepID=A0A4Q7TYS4_9MICO|nr:VOC family protein [Leucobacter luti]MBL3698776.1 glyoxalase [Leucobacter luti]RZT66153.1 catechol 2,3-dioxygenase-like lactoylglutathione lyase family enzyme [Leucobacter luti]